MALIAVCGLVFLRRRGNQVVVDQRNHREISRDAVNRGQRLGWCCLARSHRGDVVHRQRANASGFDGILDVSGLDRWRDRRGRAGPRRHRPAAGDSSGMPRKKEPKLTNSIRELRRAAAPGMTPSKTWPIRWASRGRRSSPWRAPTPVAGLGTANCQSLRQADRRRLPAR